MSKFSSFIKSALFNNNNHPIYFFDMKRYIKFICLISFSIILLPAFAQEKDISDYFDDGGISNIKYVFKLGIDPLNGEIPIFIERTGQSFSAEFGVGYVSSSFQMPFYKHGPMLDPDNRIKQGFMISLNGKIHFNGTSQGMYYGINPRINFIDDIVYYDVAFISVGYQNRIQDLVIFDINLGLGVRFYEDKSVWSTGDNSMVVIPLHIKLGFGTK